MEIISGVNNINKDRFSCSIVSVGNFDGCHIGHQEIFRRLRLHALDSGCISCVITFDPHPDTVVFNDHHVDLIFSMEERIKAIESMGIDFLVIERFTREFANMTPDEFVEEILLGRVRARGMVVGHDFCFGRAGAGDIDFLRAMSHTHGYFVDVVDAIERKNILVSSSIIRDKIRSGEVKLASELMLYPYRMSGKVIHGKSRGRDIGFPTANINPSKTLIPSDGVYAAFTYVDGVRMQSVVNIGTNPTFGDVDLSVEVFIFNMNRDIYGKDIIVEFIERLRQEIRFRDKLELRHQIEKDCARAKEILDRVDKTLP